MHSYGYRLSLRVIRLQEMRRNTDFNKVKDSFVSSFLLF